jgi:hypothetical protein
MAIACILALAVSGAVADVATINASADISVMECQPDTSERFNDLYLGDWDNDVDENMRSYLLFDTTFEETGVPAGASVSSMTLNLYHHYNGLDWDSESDLEVRVYEAAIETPWNDEWSAPYSPTWNSQPEGDGWRTGSLLDSATFDYETATGRYYTFNVTDAWASNSSLDLVLDTPDNTGQWNNELVGFHQRTNDNQPYLEVTYEQEPIPEPGTLALFGIGLPPLIGWKRRREG